MSEATAKAVRDEEVPVPQHIRDFLLNECEYKEPVKMLIDGRIACIMPLLFTAAIIVVVPRTMYMCYEDRWCYHSLEAARAALNAWDGRGEPQGWHRHPATGRRRDDGDPLREYINP